MEIFVLGDIWKKGTEPRTVRRTCTDIIFLSPLSIEGLWVLWAAVQTVESGSYDDDAGTYLCILRLFIYYTLCAKYQDGIVT